ncbi:hypothetical protein M9435_000115 [Picochlorum sp. BPE23]|nr:hypothetical protein M9435_000115 [Picochlorum sp. BPE23]
MLRIVKLGGIGAFSLIAWYTILSTNLSASTHVIVLLSPLIALVLFGIYLLISLIVASWCVPCQRLVRVFESLTHQFEETVAFVKVDCEATAANKALAASYSVAAYPTVKLFRDKKVKKEMRGLQRRELLMPLLDESREMRELQKIKSRAGQQMAEEMADKMEYMKEQMEYDEFLETSRALSLYMKNIILLPEEEKYRRIRMENRHFQGKIGSKPGGVECMKIVGFEEEKDDDGQTWLVMNTVSPSLIQVAKLLGRALPPPVVAPPQEPEPQASTSGQVSPQDLSRMLANMFQSNNRSR